MARFDVYANSGRHAKTTPWLLDVQSDLLDELDSRVVIPLRHITDFTHVKLPERLTPLLTVAGQEFLLETPKLAAVPRRLLRHRANSLAHERDRILAALDFLFQGY